MTLIAEIESQPALQKKLQRHAQILNPGKDLNVPTDSYNYILPWHQRPSKNWTITHCYRVGYISTESLEQKTLSKWSALDAKSLKFTDLESLYASTPPQTQTVPPLELTHSQYNEELQENRDDFLERNKYEWGLSFGIITGAEFSNASGFGITDEISLFTSGIEIGTSRYVTDWLSIYGKYRYIYITSAETRDLTRTDLVGKYDHQLAFGFDFHPLSRFNIGAIYKSSRWLLYRRSVPIFVLESFSKQVEIAAFKFEWVFYETNNGGSWALVGIYGHGLESDRHYKVKDYHTAFVFKDHSVSLNYEVSLAYELNSFEYGSAATPPSSITEINRNRYLINLQILF